MHINSKSLRILPSHFDSQGGFAFRGLLIVGLLMAVALLSLAYIFGKVVPPGQMGVRQISLNFLSPLGLKQGFSDKGLAPGYHWRIPGYSEIHLVPQELQILHIHRNRTRYAQSEGSLEVQTTDGSSVLADITVLSRVYDGPGEIEIKGDKFSHGGPGDLIRELGPSPDRWRATILKDSVNELRRSLGALSTSEFYDPFKREHQLEMARNEISRKLARWGVKIEGVLLRRYTYSEERIDREIFAKNLQVQEERLKAAASRLAEARATLEQVAAELDANIETLNVEGQNKVRVIRSEADLYETEQRAKADLAVARARAEVDRLKAGVLAQTKGSQIFVAREMAPLLGSLSGGVVTDIDPYDINSWLKRFGIKEGEGVLQQ